MEHKKELSNLKINNKKVLIKKISISIILFFAILTVTSKIYAGIKQNSKKNANTLSLNKEIKFESDSIKLVQITNSPKHISLVAEYKKYVPDKYDIVLMDSKGNEYENEDMGGTEDNFFSTDVTFVYKQIEKSKFQSVKILVPKFERFHPDKLNNVQYVPLDSQLPVDVTVGKNKKITIDSVDEKDGQFEIIFSTEGFPVYTFASAGGISLYDKTMNKGDKYAYDRVHPEVLENNKYRITVSNIRGTYRDNEYVNYNRYIEDSAICIGNYDDMYQEIGNITI